MLVLSGCVPAVTEPTATSTLSTSPTTTSPTITSGTEPGDAHTLDLAKGDVSDSFVFESEDPATHAFDVTIEMPVGAELEITFLTADGVTLYIFDPTVRDCDEENGQLSCVQHFPILEAHLPGRWAANVHKLSERPARVAISVVWLPIEQNT